MKKYIFILLAALTFVACSEDEGNVIESQPRFVQSKNIPQETVQKTDMPTWLSKKVQDIEENLKPLAQYKVYQGVWKDNTIYYIWGLFSSCYFGETYDQQGNHIDWEKNDFKDFDANSHDWKVIYTIEWKSEQ